MNRFLAITLLLAAASVASAADEIQIPAPTAPSGKEIPGQSLNLDTCVILGLKYTSLAEHSYALPEKQKPEFDKYVHDLGAKYPSDKELIDRFAKLSWEHRKDISPLTGGFRIYGGCVDAQFDAAKQRHDQNKGTPHGPSY